MPKPNRYAAKKDAHYILVRDEFIQMWLYVTSRLDLTADKKKAMRFNKQGVDNLSKSDCYIRQRFPGQEVKSELAE